MMEAALPVTVCIVALLSDRIFGEPKWHPLVLFGRFAKRTERSLNNSTKSAGILGVLLVTVPPSLIIYLIQINIEIFWLRALFDLLVMYIVIGWQSMKEHALAVMKPLVENKIETAREKLGVIVSRETKNMDEELIVGSTIESVLENGHDCVFASLFWYALLGPAGAVCHRLVNTLDAMWGYKNDRFLHFGWFAARLDDVMGWAPARLTAICYGLAGSLVGALSAWRDQSAKHKSPNAGLVIASGAGSLGILIGGPVTYDGMLQDKPWLGSGSRAVPRDISRTLTLVDRSLAIWMGIYALIILAIASQF
jgi:adenosylcobinamide-phosphate synthase